MFATRYLYLCILTALFIVTVNILHTLQEYLFHCVYICVVVLVELTWSLFFMEEENGPIVSSISYNQSLANHITINFYPVTYDQYLNVLGFHLPDDIDSLDDIESKQVSFIYVLFQEYTIMCISHLSR